jgi:hypothetical protein
MTEARGKERKRIGERGPRRPDPIDQIIWAARLPKCHPGDVTNQSFFCFFASPLPLLPDTVGLAAFPGLRSGKHHRPLAFLFLYLFSYYRIFSRGGLSRLVFIWHGAVDAWRLGRSGSVDYAAAQRTCRVVGSNPICFAADLDPTGKER